MTDPVLRRLLDATALPIRLQQDSPVSGQHATDQGVVVIAHGQMTAGKSAGLEVCVVDTGTAQSILLPGRGMGIWRIRTADTEFRWQSPVDGPVHPALVPLSDPDGLGWLEGFDELFVRCGLESSGAPDRGPDGAIRYPLHGRIANLPAHNLAVRVDRASGRVELRGDVIESKLFFKRLRLRSSASFTAGTADVAIADEVTNELSAPATVQMLYHLNLGAPVLQPGASVHAPVRVLAPKDAHAAAEIERWQQIDGPQAGYQERVYLAQLYADAQGMTAAMLRTPEGDRGLGVSFDTRTLPYFILWKNTAALSDGYVVGLEPATNFPHRRSQEAARGRVVQLASGQSVTFRLTIHPLGAPQQVAAFQQRIDTLATAGPPTLHSHPQPEWS